MNFGEIKIKIMEIKITSTNQKEEKITQIQQEEKIKIEQNGNFCCFLYF